jgi:hypothetical protein
MEQKQVQSEEVAVKEAPQSQDLAVANDVVTTDMVTAENQEQVASQLLDMEDSKFNTAREHWTPDTVGETKMLLFEGYDVELLPDQKTGEEVKVPMVHFIEGYNDKDGKPALRKLRMSVTTIVREFLKTTGSKAEGGFDVHGTKRPLGSIWVIRYTGDRKSITNPQHSIKMFDINYPKRKA